MDLHRKLLLRNPLSLFYRSHYISVKEKRASFLSFHPYKAYSSSSRLNGDFNSTALEGIVLPHIRKRLPIILENEWKTTFRVKDSNDPKHPKFIEIRECHLCVKGNRSKPDNLWKLGMYYNGGFHCFRCDKSGNWSQFLEECKNRKSTELCVSELDQVQHREDSISSEEVPPEQGPEKTITTEAEKKQYTFPHQSQYFQYYLNLFPKHREYARTDYQRQLKQNRERVKSYLHDNRKLNDVVLRKYFVGFTIQAFLNDDNEFIDQVCITFPWMIPEAQIQKDQMTFPPIESMNSKAGKTKSFTPEELAQEQLLQQTPLLIEKDQINLYTVRMKYRSLETKGLQRMLPKGGMWGFFGWHTVRPETDKAIIITEGEYDCMAVSQVIHDPVISENLPFREIPVVSLPNGCSSLPQELVDRLQSFEKIYLWMDNDTSGQAAVEKFSQKLGVKRCWIVTPPETMTNPPKDANDALRQDPQLIIRMLSQARRQSHQKIEDLSKYREVVLHTLITQQQVKDFSSSSQEGQKKTTTNLDEGTVTPSLPGLMGKIKGFRRGEVVIVSGPTGSGKTTLLSQLSLDFALAGKATLWGSFEMKHQDLIMKMFQQYYRANPSTVTTKPSKEELNKMYDEFKALPIEFLKSSLPSSLSEFFTMISDFIEEERIEHLLIDNLQFLLHHYLLDPDNSSNNKKSSDSSMLNGDRLESQDRLFEKFRKLATEKNINIIIVIHPRKAEDDQLLGLSSIGGTAKATQEADIVLIIQKLQDKKYLDVKKNRYNGKVGKLRLYYYLNSNRFWLPLWENRYPALPSGHTSSSSATVTFLNTVDRSEGERVEVKNNSINPETKVVKYQRAQYQPKPMEDPASSIGSTYTSKYRKPSYQRKNNLFSPDPITSEINGGESVIAVTTATTAASTSSFPATVQRRKVKKSSTTKKYDSNNQTEENHNSSNSTTVVNSSTNEVTTTNHQSYYETMAAEYQSSASSGFEDHSSPNGKDEISAHQSYYEQMAQANTPVAKNSFPKTVKAQRSRSKSKTPTTTAPISQP